MTTTPRKCWPRIKLVSGQWYAFGGKGHRHDRNWLLSFAITYCNKLNADRAARKE